MKKPLFVALLGIFSITLFAQARLGHSVEDIKAEFYQSEYNLESGYTEDGVYYITYQLERAGVVHFCNDDKVSMMSVIIPNNQGALNYIVESYNSRYVIVSSTEWKMYSGDGIANCELVFDDDGGYSFIWTIEE